MAVPCFHPSLPSPLMYRAPSISSTRCRPEDGREEQKDDSTSSREQTGKLLIRLSVVKPVQAQVSRGQVSDHRCLELQAGSGHVDTFLPIQPSVGFLVQNYQEVSFQAGRLFL